MEYENNHPSTRQLPPQQLMTIAALIMAGSLSISTQAAESDSEGNKTLKTVTVKDTLDSATASKENLLVKKAGIAKGQQDLKDIPQTVTVMTEKLMDDRNMDDFREVMKSTAGVTFQAGETGEEDVRMRGFSLAQAGDIYVDGMRDAPLIERDMFNVDRVEVLKGSASMLFGKGSTGGVVNQVSKQPFLMDQSEANLTVGNGNSRRLTVDFNLHTGQSGGVLNFV
jgi:catecholate siderophore receptor